LSITQRKAGIANPKEEKPNSVIAGLKDIKEMQNLIQELFRHKTPAVHLSS